MPPTTAAAADRHPAHLGAADRRYLVDWGRYEMLRVIGVAAFGLAALTALVTISKIWALLALAVPVLATVAIAILFFRNPSRRAPGDPGVLLSPADGRVVEAGRVEYAEHIGGPALKVAIFLSIFDVHVNRAPASARVEHRMYRPGAFRDARDPLCALENESLSIGGALEEPETSVGARFLIRLISGAVARRIVCPLKIGDRIERGGLIGMIKYGSRAELYVGISAAPVWELAVKPGDRVRGGETVLLRVGPRAAAAEGK